ncbi:serine/threonine-protein kinase [Lyngbya confervoides]|uniref:non-specific serine/threonine protein kinase n=1 Tax=Lyngbya confervoides BDU141951 TaxID=1574623 RepID=A0ABD4T678_9CYAN|nr:serine/threonine-protein kinase [Lyngbya confervoides]MCM1984008.1 serine/threonine protein kinase [Lyngbya confervoides BDU141951]
MSLKHMSQSMPSLLANRYRVLRVLGEGGFGITYLAADTQMPSKRHCVIKQLKVNLQNSQLHQLVQERFEREAAILESLGAESSQIPHLYAYFSQAGQFFLVQEWVQGQTLAQAVQHDGVFSEAAVVEVLRQVLTVLDYVHGQRIVHRDIKPDNIMLRSPDNLPVLLDFGAVKESMNTVIQATQGASRSIVVGTPGFMPSEQVAGRPCFSSDLYSLGLTAIYLLTGKGPLDLPSDPATGDLGWHSHAPQVSSPLAQILDRAIQVHPRDRFSTATEMLTALNGLEVASPFLGSGSPSVADQTLHQGTAPEAGSATVALEPDLQNAAGSDWKRAGLMGGLVALLVIAAAIIVRTQILAGVLRNRAVNPHRVSEILPGPAASSSPQVAASPPPISAANPIAREGYCSFLSTRNQADIINDPCTIVDFQNGSYAVNWSQGRVTQVQVKPQVRIDGRPATVVDQQATSLTLKTNRGNLGICWDCSP